MEEHVLNELTSCINEVSAAQEYYRDNLLGDYPDYFSYRSYIVLVFYYTEQCFSVLVYQAPNPVSQAREPPHGGSI